MCMPETKDQWNKAGQADDADPVVCECGVLGRSLDLWHVTTCTVFRADAAGRARWLAVVFDPAGLTWHCRQRESWASRIVLQRLQWDHNSKAGRAGGIPFAPALAVFKTVRGEANVYTPIPAKRDGDHILPSAVARTAEDPQINRIQAAGICDQLLALLLRPRSHCGCMTRSWAVARLASDTKNGALAIELIPGHRRRRMTAETSAGFAASSAVQRHLQAAGCGERLSGSDIQILPKK